MNVLIADPTELSRKITKSMLKELGCKDVIEAADGEEALRILENEMVNIILADMRLSKISGLELLKKVRANNRTQAIPFLLITGSPDKTLISNAIEAKVTHLLIRPYTANQLHEKIKAINPLAA